MPENWKKRYLKEVVKMPIYKGYCKRCDQKFKIFVRSFHFSPETIFCPKCQNPGEKLFSRFHACVKEIPDEESGGEDKRL